MLVKYVQSTEPALHQEYWKEMTVNSTIEQHSHTHIKKDQENTAGGYEKDTENAHTISQGKHRQANEEARKMDKYTQ